MADSAAPMMRNLQVKICEGIVDMLTLLTTRTFAFSALTLLFGQQEAGCWFVNGDDLNGALHVAPLVTSTSIILAAIKSMYTP